MIELSLVTDEPKRTPQGVPRGAENKTEIGWYATTTAGNTAKVGVVGDAQTHYCLDVTAQLPVSQDTAGREVTIVTMQLDQARVEEIIDRAVREGLIIRPNDLPPDYLLEMQEITRLFHDRIG